MKNNIIGLSKVSILVSGLLLSSCEKESPIISDELLLAPSSIDSINAGNANLNNPSKKEIAMKLIASAENSTLDWRTKFGYIEDIQDGRGYTAGIIGFTTATGDILDLVTAYTVHAPGNVLSSYIPALKSVKGTESHLGLDPNFKNDWIKASTDIKFQAEQENLRDKSYFEPALKLAQSDSLHALGQFIYFDAAVVHGYSGLVRIRKEALKTSKTPSNGVSEEAYLNIFLDKRVLEMKKEEAHADVSRIEDAQRVFLKKHNYALNLPLEWKVYGEIYRIEK